MHVNAQLVELFFALAHPKPVSSPSSLESPSNITRPCFPPVARERLLFSRSPPLPPRPFPSIVTLCVL